MPAETLTPQPEATDDLPKTEIRPTAEELVERAYQTPPSPPWDRGRTEGEIRRTDAREAAVADQAADWQRSGQAEPASLDPTVYRTGSIDQPLAPYERGARLDQIQPPAPNPEPTSSVGSENGLKPQITDPWNPQFNQPETPDYTVGRNIPLEVVGSISNPPGRPESTIPINPPEEPEIISQSTVEALPDRPSQPIAAPEYTHGNKIPLDVPGVLPNQPERTSENQPPEPPRPDTTTVDKQPPVKKNLFIQLFNRLFPPES